MFDDLEMAPPDAILGLTDAFKSDERPGKINLGVGVYKDEHNKTPVLAAVKEAEKRLLASEESKSYLPIPGSAAYGARVRELLFEAGSPQRDHGLAMTAQTPGGTGGLRVAADFIDKCRPGIDIYMSDPTWANHNAIFTAAGLKPKTYPYYDYESKSLKFEAMMEALAKLGPRDVVLLHGCCHNPSGMDPDPQQWDALAELASERGFLPLFDFAYQGFGDGLEEDAYGLRAFVKRCPKLMVVSSFSKNFGLYCERTGAITVCTPSAEETEIAFSHIKTAIRANYSNPPAHGGLIVNAILSDPALRKQWEDELADMRGRINAMRTRFVESLQARGVAQDFSFIATQKGMFSFSGLDKTQVARLKDEFAIYIVGSGRINVAGMTENNIDQLCDAVAAVL